MKDLPQIAKQYKSHGFVLLALANFSFRFPGGEMEQANEHAWVQQKVGISGEGVM